MDKSKTQLIEEAKKQREMALGSDSLAKATPGGMYFTEMPDLTEDEYSERSFDFRRLFQISQVRESSLPQFDGMGYSRWNETNEMADISYLAPKKNKGDTRITSGITHEKDSALVSFFLNMNFEGNVRIFYKDKELTDFGTTLTKLARKSREEESYDDKRAYFYRNYISQGTSFSREQYSEIWIPDKKLTGLPNPTELDKLQWTDNGFKKVSVGFESILVDGKKVFLENIREPNIQKQPGVITVEYVPREIMMSAWGNTPRWKNVPFMVTPTAQSLGTLSQGSIYSDLIWGEIDFNKVEVIQVYRPFEQRYQMYINGIPMLPCKFPLKAISPSGDIPIAKGDADLMNMFAYSKSEPSKTKIDQAVFDEILQNMVMKQRQSAMVPRGNLSDRIVTPDMFLGGRVISNLDPTQTPPLIENPGITPADFNFYNLFKQHIDDKTISSILQGQQPSSEGMTLGQYMDQQKKAFLVLGSKIDGIINWERQMLKLRVANIITHVHQEKEGGGYHSISMQDSMSDGSDGMNVVNFSSPNIKTPDEVMDEELAYEKANGTQVAYTYIDPKLMLKVLDDPDYYMCYEIIPVDKNNDMFTQMTFTAMITQAGQLFGLDSLQVDRLKKRYAQVMGEVYDDLFLNPQELQAKQAQAQTAAAQQNPQNPAQQQTNQPTPQAPIPSPFKPPMPSDQPQLNS